MNKTILRIGRRGMYTATSISLRVRNVFSRRSIVDARSTHVVSLTTYGDRLQNVHLAIESIARGDVRPRRLMVWCDLENHDAPLPKPLRRLIRRGLEVCSTPDYGPHTKYFPYAISNQNEPDRLVLADDDVLYPTSWLSSLLRESLRYPYDVVCFRAHRIIIDEVDNIAPYVQWPPALGTDPSFLHFATAVSGVVLPQKLVSALRARDDAFLETAPRADDVWINAVAIEEGIRTRQVEIFPRLFPPLRGTVEGSLALQNVDGGGNDRQINATYGRAARQTLSAESLAE
jgi:hypothetical protein